jgi:plastocyanin
MDHDEWLELISAEADGELDDVESARLAEHLAGCASCSDLLAGFEGDRRRARMRTRGEGEHLVGAVLEARAGDHVEADRVRGVLLRRSTAAAVGLAAAIIALVAITSGTTSMGPAAPEPQYDALIAARDRSFDSADIEVDAGTTVEWRNAGSTTHHLVRKLGGVVVDEDLPPGTTETATFEEPGVFEYYCAVHPEMTGTITVDA